MYEAYIGGENALPQFHQITLFTLYIVSHTINIIINSHKLGIDDLKGWW